MKNTERTLKAFVTKQLLIEAAIAILVLGLIALGASWISEAAFWKHASL